MKAIVLPVSVSKSSLLEALGDITYGDDNFDAKEWCKWDIERLELAINIIKSGLETHMERRNERPKNT
jgi:hypothetical protein